MKTNTIKTQGAQGDVLFRRVAGLPKDAKPMENDGKRIVVAHSETGHDHIIALGKSQARLFSGSDPQVCYLQSGAGHLDVEHLRPFDTHATLRLLMGEGVTWEVRRQREWTPEGWRRVED